MKEGFLGKWRLVEMERWYQDVIESDRPGHIAFPKGGAGTILLGMIDLTLAWEPVREGKVQFTFQGFVELDEVSGRGWAKVVSNGLIGHVKFHEGDQTRFRAERWRRRQ